MAADKKTLAGIEEILHDGEKVTATLRAVLWVSNSSNANPSGLLALTDERLIFAGSVRHTATLVTHPLTDLHSIEFERALIASFLRIGTGDEASPTVTTFRPNPGLAPRFVDAVTAAMARAAASSRHRRPPHPPTHPPRRHLHRPLPAPAPHPPRRARPRTNSRRSPTSTTAARSPTRSSPQPRRRSSAPDPGCHLAESDTSGRARRSAGHSRPELTRSARSHRTHRRGR